MTTPTEKASNSCSYLYRLDYGRYSTSKVALCSVSQFFCASFTSDFKERTAHSVRVHVSPTEASVWRTVLDAALQHELPSDISSNEILVGARLALRWLMPRVGQMFIERFDLTTTLDSLDDVNSVAVLHDELESLYSEMDIPMQSTVLSRCEDFLVKRFAQIELCWRRQGLLQLSPSAFETLLQSSKLQVDAEDSLWEIILEWAAVSPLRSDWLAKHHSHGMALLKVPFLSSTLIQHAVCPCVPVTPAVVNALQAASFINVVARSDKPAAQRMFSYYLEHESKAALASVQWQFTARQYAAAQTNTQRVLVFKCRRQVLGQLDEYRPVASKAYRQLSGDDTDAPVLAHGPVANDVLFPGGVRVQAITIKVLLDTLRDSMESTLEAQAADWGARSWGLPSAAQSEHVAAGAGASTSHLTSVDAVGLSTASLEKQRAGGTDAGSSSDTQMPSLGLHGVYASAGLVPNHVGVGDDGFPQLPAADLGRCALTSLHSGLNTGSLQVFLSTKRAVHLNTCFRDSMWGYESLEELQGECTRQLRPSADERWFTGPTPTHLHAEQPQETHQPNGEESYIFVVLRLTPQVLAAGGL